jgi:hypothetical protein
VKSITVSVPSPVGGVNARDSLAAMPATDAVIMDNWFPQPSYVSLRNGTLLWASGLPTHVNTVMAFNGFTARKLFGVSGTAIYDITSQGAVGAAVVTGLSTDKLQHAMFNAGGGNFLVWVDGIDTPQFYNGTAGNILTFNTLVGGTLYTTGTYNNVPLTGGSGTGALGTVVIAGGSVTSVTIVTNGWGQNYLVGDTLSALAANIGGTGSGFSVNVATLSAGWHPCVMSGSGLNPVNLITITVHQQRCWYIEQNTMNVWYASVTGFQGALTKLPLGSLFKMGGTLMQMCSWAIQNVSGINDYAAFISTEGEIALYQGYDPSQVSTWSLVGMFRIGRPIGRRCYTRLAADIAVITADGLTSLNAAVLTDRIDPDKQLTYKILNAINGDVQNYNANFGWQVIDYPLGNKLIVNVPEVTNSVMHQWVQNPISKAWCRFRNWNANCWELQQDALYYGENTQVFLADTGMSDAGVAIVEDCKPAFSYFDKPGQIKRFVMARPIFQANAAIQPVISLNVDFQDIQGAPPIFTAASGSPWNTSPWNTSPWASANVFIKNWQGIAGLGYVASGRITLQTSGVTCNWYSTDFMFEPGGPI